MPRRQSGERHVDRHSFASHGQVPCVNSSAATLSWQRSPHLSQSHSPPKPSTTLMRYWQMSTLVKIRQNRWPVTWQAMPPHPPSSCRPIQVPRNFPFPPYRQLNPPPPFQVHRQPPLTTLRPCRPPSIRVCRCTCPPLPAPTVAQTLADAILTAEKVASALPPVIPTRLRVCQFRRSTSTGEQMLAMSTFGTDSETDATRRLIFRSRRSLFAADVTADAATFIKRSTADHNRLSGATLPVRRLAIRPPDATDSSLSRLQKNSQRELNEL